MEAAPVDEPPNRLAAVPWWAWALAAGLVWVGGQLLTDLPPPAKSTLASDIQIGMLGGFGFVLSWLGSIFLIIIAGVTGLRRAEARARSRGDSAADGLTDEPGPRFGRARGDRRRWSPDLIRSLEWKRVEKLAALYLRALKFHVEEALPGPEVGGVDMRVYLPGSTAPGILVQCRGWSSWQVGVDKISRLHAFMMAEEVNEGLYVATTTFSVDAIDFARERNIALIDGADLLAKLLDLSHEDQKRILTAVTEGDFTTPTCPSCGFKMVTRVEKTTGDAYWGCPRFPACAATMQMRLSPA